MIHNIKLLIEYDGTNYRGWQRQASPNREEGDLHKTIQGTVEDVLSGIIKHPVKVTAAGRTDAGVHAFGQVVHFRTAIQINESSWVKALNSLLPADIVVTKAEYAPAEFNARFDAKSKVYKYIILNSPILSPFHRNYVWHVKQPLNPCIMREASQFLIGHYDFSSFRAADCSARSPVKSLHRIDIDEAQGQSLYLPFSGMACSSSVTGREPDKILILTFEARSFLQHMVRNIVGTLAEAGRGKIEPCDVKKILEKRDRRCAGPIAPPQGLYLSEVRY